MNFERNTVCFEKHFSDAQFSIDEGADFRWDGNSPLSISSTQPTHQFRRRASGAANEKPRPAVKAERGLIRAASRRGRIFMPYKSFECKCIDRRPFEKRGRSWPTYHLLPNT